VKAAEKQPELVRATDLSRDDVGSFAWDPSHNAHVLTVSGPSVEWGARKVTYQGKLYPPAWVPIRTLARLHSAAFRWDFVVDEMANRQVGVGFMLAWENGLLDWGFYGYLGAGTSAWAYDPSTGDIVTETRSIAGGLPTIENGRSGTVSVVLDLPREGEGRGVFVVNGVETPPVPLPVGAVVVPAACLLAETQKVTLGGFSRSSR
jgi:hypothetical protein